VLEPALEDGPFLRLAPELRGEVDDCAPVGDRSRNVRPLARVGALREEPPELVERLGMSREDAVRMLVDEADLV
jgi:hypothetical protein